jgi:heat shock protein HslJ
MLMHGDRSAPGQVPVSRTVHRAYVLWLALNADALEVFMRGRTITITSLTLVIVAGSAAIGRSQVTVVSWLDDPTPASWNTPRETIPAAPENQGTFDPRCREAARSPQLKEDAQLRDQGWELVGAYQGGWEILVIRGTAGYDGMCRPRQYQEFVFVRGVFAGTLSPHPMDSRADGALTRVWIQSSRRLTAEYIRYASTDPLCCPSSTTTVVFDLSNDPLVLQPVSASSTARIAAASPATANPLEGTSWQLVRFQGSDDTTLTPDDRTKYVIEFGPSGQLTARIDCNRGRGTWKSDGSSQLQFGPLALTRAMCPTGSLHDQVVKQWGNIRSFVIRDGHLFLALMADGGIYEFEPAAPASSAAPADVGEAPGTTGSRRAA